MKTTNGFQKVIDHFNWKDEKPESETILNDADYKTVPSTRVSACFSITLSSLDIPVTTYKQPKQRRSVSQFLCKAKYQLIEKFPDLPISTNIPPDMTLNVYYIEDELEYERVLGANFSEEYLEPNLPEHLLIHQTSEYNEPFIDSKNSC